MREGSQFRCPDCGLSSPVGTDCPECQIAMVDENGNASVRPSGEDPTFGTLRSVFGGIGAVGAGALLTLWGLPAWPAAIGLVAGGGIVVARGIAIPLVRGARRVAERRVRALRLIEQARAVGPSESIASRELVRCRGEVRVLRAVQGTIPRSAEARRSVCAFQRGSERVCGRFAVVGEHGVAVVDEDCFEVWRRGRGLPLARVGGVVEDGARLEVVGPATHAPVADAVLLHGSPDARRTDLALYFDGRPGSPVLLLL